GAELFTKASRRMARWKAKGKARTAPVTVGTEGAERIVTASRTWFAKYRDGAGIIQTVATGCRDEQAARNRLAELEKTAKRVRGNISTTAEEKTAGLSGTALTVHLDAYVTSLDAAGVTVKHRDNVRGFLDRLAADCEFTRLADLDRGPVINWLAD